MAFYCILCSCSKHFESKCWNNGSKSNFLLLHLCIWQVLLFKVTYFAFRLYILSVNVFPGNQRQFLFIRCYYFETVFVSCHFYNLISHISLIQAIRHPTLQIFVLVYKKNKKLVNLKNNNKSAVNVL